MSYRSTTDTAKERFADQETVMKKLSTYLRESALYKFFTRKAPERYKPEKHYMRGPGPKARAKGITGPRQGDAQPEQREVRT
jgi:hypothetical protein